MSKGSKGSDTPAIYYQQLAQSNAQIAETEQQIATQQLGWAKDQYADFAPYVKNYEGAATDSMRQQSDQAKDLWNTYQGTYAPIEKQFAETAQGWNTPARANQQAGAAQADVATQYDQARAAATANLESYGIDPSQTRFAALDLGTRVSQAAATAGAGTQSRINTEATGLGLMGEAINTGRGYSSDVSRAYAGATQAGSSGVTAGLNTSSTYGNLIGTGTQWGGLANTSRATAVNAAQGFGQYETGRTQAGIQSSAQTGQTIGSVIGLVGAIAAM